MLKPRLFVLFAPALPCRSQETRGQISGTVTDPHSSSVAGAMVVVTNTETNTSVKLTTNSRGYYEASLLLPCAYRITTEAPVFKKLAGLPIDLERAFRNLVADPQAIVRRLQKVGMNIGSFDNVATLAVRVGTAADGGPLEVRTSCAAATLGANDDAIKSLLLSP